jgi:hypothetical protein
MTSVLTGSTALFYDLVEVNILWVAVLEFITRIIRDLHVVKTFMSVFVEGRGKGVSTGFVPIGGAQMRVVPTEIFKLSPSS